MDRSKVDSILTTRTLRVGRDRAQLDHLANLLLEGSFTKEHGILAPSRYVYPGLPSVKPHGGQRGRLQDNTYDPTEGMIREETNMMSGDGEVEVDEEQEEE